jgi:rhodanese-related sulfurtransferase
MFNNLFGKKQYTDLSLAEFKASLVNDLDAIILDVRTKEEFAGGHIPGARKLDFFNGEFSKEIPLLDPEKHYYVYCRSGNRSSSACGQLAKAGFKKIFNLKGGYTAW